VAVRAPHDALSDLVLEELQRHLSTDQIRDVRGLAADVIEVEHNSVRLPAVRAIRSSQYFVDVVGVTRSALADDGRWAATLDRTSSMATGAHHFAERQLFVQAGGPDPEVGKLTKTHPFSPDMVELENDGVGGAAVGARVRHEIREQVGLCAQTPAGERGAGLRAVQIAARLEVLPATPSAPVLTAPEQRCREHQPAAVATPLGAKVGHRKPAADELRGARSLEVPCRRWGLSGPHAYRADTDTQRLRDGAKRGALCPEPPRGLLFGSLRAHESMLAPTSDRSARNLAAWIVP
jgi:hypothetical protein